MKRRVIKQGNNTLTITLPRKWTEKFKIKAGDELEIGEKRNDLIINTKKESSLGKISIHIPKNSVFPRRLIFTPYFKGYDEIEISFEDENALNWIQKCSETMLGFEIIHQGKSYCILKNVAKGIETEFKNIFNRLALISISMGKDLYECLKENNIEKLPNVARMEELSNKFCLFCKRMLNGHYEGEERNNSLYRLTCLFEEIADDYEEICNVILSHKLKIKPEILELIRKINDFADSNYKLIQKYDLDKLCEFKKNESILLKEVSSLISKTKGDEALILCSLLHIVKTNHNIAEEAL